LFQFHPDWYRTGEVRGIAIQYYGILRKILKENSHLRKCLTRCRHCGIFFLTHPRNAGRKDLRCPFGCRQTHRKRSSTKRSVEYYQNREGKGKKQLLNGRRNQKAYPEQQRSEAGREGAVCPDATGLVYLQTVISLIEQRRVSMKEIVSLLRKKMRQHSIGKRQIRGYTERKGYR